MSADIAAIRNPDIEPTHPGELLREMTLPALKLKVTEAATKLGVTRVYLHRILACEAPVLPKTAIKIEKEFGVNADLLVRLQGDHDTWRAYQTLQAIRKKMRRAA